MKKRNPYTFTPGLLSFLFFVAALTSFILIGVSSQGGEDPSTALGMVLILSLVGFGICLILYIIFTIIGYKKNKKEPSPQGVPSTGKSEGEIPCPYCHQSIPASSSFCPKCGKNLFRKEEESSQTIWLF